jgi:hypothetical protein
MTSSATACAVVQSKHMGRRAFELTANWRHDSIKLNNVFVSASLSYVRISVKTRSSTSSGKSVAPVILDQTQECDYAANQYCYEAEGKL